ncbi:PH domain-containing protein [Cumulibacter manganitolerans]|uniref:PH domain-containing protein n=1 Tax=Cumulibacter manganitolerans TaxID=1884992 RepID=UPI001297D179|nr:PH domain-containing protein [Cumulibacter manganitolerans]
MRRTDTRPAASADAARPADRPLRIRYSRTLFVPLLIAAICTIPLATALDAWGLLLLLPFAFAVVLLLRVGADVYADRVVVRGMLSSSTVRRADLAGFAVPDGRHVHLMRADGSTVRLSTARPRDLPRLRELLFDDAPSRDSPASG